MTLRRVLLLITIALLTAGAIVAQSALTPAAAAARLVPYSSCDEALTELKQAARRSLEESRRHTGSGPIGVVPPATLEDAAGSAEAQPDSGAASSAPRHSSTTVHEAGVDEPDLVKTDGRRIVSVTGGELRVTDPVTHRVTTARTRGPIGDSATVSLHGDRALVAAGSQRRSGRYRGTGSALTLFDLGPSGSTPQPRELGTLSTDGEYVDARQVGSQVRVVVRFQPGMRTVRAIESSTIADWLPRYRVERDGVTSSYTVGCDQLSHPASYSGTSMLTVLTIDLGSDGIGDGEPMTIVADGQTVYGTGESLYVANARQRPGPAWSPAPQTTTELFKFDVSRPGRPVYSAGGEVGGALLNQYSLSEHDGFLRVATTSYAQQSSQSAVHVLRTDGDRLETVGQVGGLGRGERIYAVRFVGPLGYVVTFKQTDPLYTLDLHDPSDPRVTGELKINGYSAYLHPAGDGRLLGVGQEASDRGRIQGSQLSLFDVSDPATPTRLAQHVLPRTRSEVEVDPHAFLYWPSTATVVMPVLSGFDRSAGAAALVVRLDGDRFAELGTIAHPGVDGDAATGLIRRSLVIGDTLWTLSDAGLSASDLRTAGRQAWVPFEPNYR